MTTGLLLGAGASCELGMPLVSHLNRELFDMFDPEALRRIAKKVKGSDNAISEKQLDELIAMMGREGQHYESIFGFLEVGDYHDALPNMPRPYAYLLLIFATVVHEMLIGRHLVLRRFISEGLCLYDGLAGLADANAPLWIFTLNHDVLIECIAARLGIPVSCGFTPERLRLRRKPGPSGEPRYFEAEIIRQSELAKGIQFAPHAKRGISLLKLHGALNTFMFNNTGEDMMRILPISDDAMGPIDTLEAFNSELELDPDFPFAPPGERSAVDDQGNGYLIRPSIVTGSHKFDERYPQNWPRAFLQIFEHNLLHVDSLICIGYGLGDLHVNLKIREWLELRGPRNLVVLSRNITEAGLPPMFRHLANRIECKKMSAVEFFQQHAASPPSDQDRVLRTKLATAVEMFNALDARKRAGLWVEHLQKRPKAPSL